MLSEQEKEIFNRSARLLGDEMMERIGEKRVIIFGVGGVGSWCAESLIRNGIRHLTMVDSDRVCITNCNRQLMATTRMVGEVKVDALKQRLLEINPEAEITALHQVYNKENAYEFQLETYDVILDAIDSLQDKADLIQHACRLAHENKRVTFISSMGAALRLDPTKIRVAEFWKVQGDPLARALRNKFKRVKEFPASKFLCIYSEEAPLPNLGETDETDERKAQINGSLCHITGIFGMTMAGLALQAIIKAGD